MDINDVGSLAKIYTDRYLAGADTKNFTSMIPGLTEVIIYYDNNSDVF